MRPIQALAVMIACVPAWALADPASVQAPDGTAITRENYPTQLSDRPVVDPPGMVLASLGLDFNLTPATVPALTAEVAYTLPHAVQLGVEGEALNAPDVEVFGNYLFSRYAAAHLWAEYNFDDGADFNRSIFAFGLGVNVKYKFPKVPIAIGGLQTLFFFEFSHWPPRESQSESEAILDETLRAANGVASWFRLPAWIELSPHKALSFVLGEQADFLLSNNIEPTTEAAVVVNPRYWGTLEFYGELVVTVRHFDIGFEVTELVDGDSPITHGTVGEVWITTRW